MYLTQQLKEKEDEIKNNKSLISENKDLKQYIFIKLQQKFIYCDKEEEGVG